MEATVYTDSQPIVVEAVLKDRSQKQVTRRPLTWSASPAGVVDLSQHPDGINVAFTGNPGTVCITGALTRADGAVITGTLTLTVIPPEVDSVVLSVKK